MKRALVLVEGYTEERFVKDVLQEHFWTLNLSLTPTLLVTKTVKDGADFRGGVTTFKKFANDVRRLLQGAGDALVTTCLDYDGLPVDFPGMATRPADKAGAHVAQIEQAIAAHFADPRFLPYLAFHEFEALLFASPDELPKAMTDMSKQAQFQAIRESYPTPEDIDEVNWPSKRIVSLFRAYRKALHRPLVAKRIGLERLRAECPHFAAWISKLEDFARQ